jgi:hypothetical protein
LQFDFDHPAAIVALIQHKSTQSLETLAQMCGGLVAIMAAIRTRQFLDDRTVRPVVAMAVVNEVPQGAGHLLKFAHLVFQNFNVTGCDTLDIAAGPAPVIP